MSESNSNAIITIPLSVPQPTQNQSEKQLLLLLRPGHLLLDTLRCLWCTGCQQYLPKSEHRFLHWNGMLHPAWITTGILNPHTGKVSALLDVITTACIEVIALHGAQCDTCQLNRVGNAQIHTLALEIETVNNHIENNKAIREHVDDCVATAFPSKLRLCTKRDQDLTKKCMWLVFDPAQITTIGQFPAQYTWTNILAHFSQQ
ncbi:hypothetical protein BT63DRAFT_454422 [Microthyrium microscopicum]|uniref:Uncharacterized protein n=1 Tax=Microthyrium microscopicum TaxID=703497 RepID=A0A6A6UD68_9PEZI|nr:hypothetical protein BT63DRAFT_454422 [Microthyrium microscopicum]